MPRTEPPPPATPRRFHWRRLLQYRLRTLLILTTICAVLFAWLSWWSHKAQQQCEVATALAQGGAIVGYDLQTRYCARWLVDMLGVEYVDYFANVVTVGIPEHTLYTYGGTRLEITDAHLDYVKDLATLEKLVLVKTQVSDAGLAHIQGLDALRELYLSDTRVTDAGLEHLRGLTELRKLDLYNTEITDAGLELLRGLTALNWLRLENTKVTKAGVTRLQLALPNCKIVAGPIHIP